jgi:Phosphotransferase enzyme family
MEAAVSALPSTASLNRVLGELLGSSTGEVVARSANDWSSSHPSEIVTFRSDGDRLVRLLCKYQRAEGNRGHGHRGGVAYEAHVYERLLSPSGMSAAFFYGAHLDHATDAAWLVIGFIEDAHSADEVPEFQDALLAAARWAGRFHALAETKVGSEDQQFLIAYDADYFAQWARRTASFTAPWHEQLPWLPSLCRRAEDLAEQQARVPRTIIHGEFTPSNILVDDGMVYPVDWESAALGMGEIDLVALVHKWPSALVAQCEDAYVSARWPEAPPADLSTRLDLARLYWEMRWLGDRPEWLAQPRLRARVNDLRAVGSRLGLVHGAGG